MKKLNARPALGQKTDEDIEKQAEETMAMMMLMRDQLELREFQPISEVKRPKSLTPKRFTNLVKLFRQVEALHLECAVYLSLPACERTSTAPSSRH